MGEDLAVGERVSVGRNLKNNQDIMQLNYRVCFIVSCFICLHLSCFSIKQLENSKLDLVLIDSINYSAKLVSVQVYNAQNDHFVAVAGERQTAEVYNITKQGKLALLEQYQITNQFGGLRGLTNVKIKETNLLVLGNKADNSLEIHQIKKNGQLEKVNAIYDSDTTFIDEIVTIHSIRLKDRHFIYAGGLDKGVSVFELSANGQLQHIQSIVDNTSLFLHGIIGMSSIVIGNKQFLLTGAFFDGGISCFQIMEDGQLKNVFNVKDDKTMFLNGTFPVNTVQLGKQNFLLVGHRHNIHYATENAAQDYHGDGINVFKINEAGQINLHSLLKDDEKLLLKGATRIETLPLNEKKALVFIGTRDDKGIQVCLLEEDGVLQPIKAIDLGYSIYNGMTIKKMNDQWCLLAGAYDKNLLELYNINFD